MAMKKLIVCGCSFSAPSSIPSLAGTAYGEVLAKKLGWDVQILARQGCSNGGIRVQIDEVIRQQPDFAIIATTFHDRMEIPASAAPYAPPKNENKGWGSDLQQHLQNTDLLNGYDANVGIDNINYGNNPYRMICETIFSLAENYNHPYRSSKLDKGTQGAVKQYINYIYDSNWKKQQDTWIIRDGIMEAFYAGIKFIVLPDNLWPTDSVRSLIPSVVPDKYLITKNEHLPSYATWQHPFTGDDPGYHGSPASQEYLADVYYDMIVKWDTL